MNINRLTVKNNSITPPKRSEQMKLSFSGTPSYLKIAKADSINKKISKKIAQGIITVFQKIPKTKEWFINATEIAGKYASKDNSPTFKINYHKNQMEEFTKFDKLKERMPNIAAAVGTGFYILNTMNNDKIEQDRKKTLAINMAIVYSFAALTGILLKPGVKIAGKKIFDFIKKTQPDMPEKVADNLRNSIKAAAPIIAFTLSFRYLGSVVATPLADKLTKKLDIFNENKNKVQ